MKEVQAEMEKPAVIDVIIPAFNEEKAIPMVIRSLPGSLVREVIVCNNGSTDRTAQIAENEGATVLHISEKGYGTACLNGIEYIRRKPGDQHPDIVVFIDADSSDYPEELPLVVHPILKDSMDLVIGSRALGNNEKGSMMPQQIFGNWLATTLIRMIYDYPFTDLGPFRAVKWDSLLALGMEDRNFGWTVEMQVRAAKLGLKCTEVPVSYRKRIGKSKVSGTIKGSVLAGHKILWTIFKLI